MPEQKPSVGRIVHYQSFGTPKGEYKSQPVAAVVTVVVTEPVDETGKDLRERVGLCILNPTGMFFNTDVPFSEEPKPGHWNWPPRV